MAKLGPPALSPARPTTLFFVLIVTGQHLGLLCSLPVKSNIIMMKKKVLLSMRNLGNAL